MAAYVETTKTGWGSRMGSSLRGVGTGFVMLAAGLALLFWNEGRAVKTHKALQEGAAAVTEADPDRIDPALDGRLVHFTADVKTDRPLRDAWFGVELPALRMERRVEMWQWQESSSTSTKENWGGSETTTTEYDYWKGWSEDRIDSAKFKVPDGHRNPAQFPVKGREIIAGKVTAGAYTVPPKWVATMGDLEPAELPSAETPLPEDAPAGMFRTAEGLYLPVHPKTAVQEVVTTVTNSVEMTLPDGTTESVDTVETVTNTVETAASAAGVGAEPADPEIGDVRVRLYVAKPGRTSFVVRQEPAGRMAAWTSSNGREIRMIRTGEASAAEMFEGAEKGNRIFTWLLRLAGLLLTVFGIRSVLGPLAMLAAVVPFLKAILSAGIGFVSWVLGLGLSLVVVGIAWLTYRPLVGIPLLVAGIGLAVWLKVGRKTPPPASAE